jgi:hypothetical protein
MSDGKYQHAYALHKAQELAAQLEAVSPRVIIGGSIRRGAQLVGDIELIVQDDEQGSAAELVDQWLHLGIMSKGQKSNGSVKGWADRYKAAVDSDGVPVDFWLVRPDRQFGVTLWYRTGSGDGNKLMVTAQEQGGLRPPFLTFNDGAIFAYKKMLYTPEEVDVFAAWGMEYVPPEERSVDGYRRWARRIVEPPTAFGEGGMFRAQFLHSLDSALATVAKRTYHREQATYFLETYAQRRAELSEQSRLLWQEKSTTVTEKEQSQRQLAKRLRWMMAAQIEACGILSVTEG